MKNNNRIITYSLLAYINNNSSDIKSSLDIFVPLIKRVLSQLKIEGISRGGNITEIKEIADKEYGLDFPVSVLTRILNTIKKEINTEEEEKIIIHNDGSFDIRKYTFNEYEDIISEQKRRIDDVETLFKEFKQNQTIEDFDTDTIFEFIEKNKYNLSKYLSDKTNPNQKDFTLEAQFILFFKESKEIYETIKDIYLGSILSCYIEYKPEIIANNKQVELLLDTNFIVGLLDLNTEESTHTCRTLLNIANKNKYVVSILPRTIQETKNLLKNKADDFNTSYLRKKVNPEDVFNACERRNLTKTDLEKIIDNIEKELSFYGINLIKTSFAEVVIRNTEEFKKFKKIRWDVEISALHDAEAILYVKKKRGRNITKFEEVNCWFVNNAFSNSTYSFNSNKGIQPEMIKADDLLNILWLSNPSMTKDFSSNDLGNIGLSSSISLTLGRNLPRTRVLKEFDDNLCKYAQDNISDEDVSNIAKRITSKRLSNSEIEDINNLAQQEDKSAYFNRLNAISDKQKEEDKKLKDTFSRVATRFIEETKKAIEVRKGYESKSDDLQQELDKKDTKIKRLKEQIEEDLKDYEVKKWQKKSQNVFLIALIISIIIYFIILLYCSEWDLKEISKTWKENEFLAWICTGILVFINLYFGYRWNQTCTPTQIEAYKRNIKLSKDLNI
ncbi:hypothetical protein [Capnocytophaga felis]|uniref:PIN domain-containing protein n=1 Tax=Capnocytophaga felis TaxID=2267611 RepID=A0A5M4B689_9FLAO|nr:hypothetical protein [Capnocytophaga felis]GET45028.1 hypothetical protein RCZ01_03300 [Capnocytophaga felis]